MLLLIAVAIAALVSLLVAAVAGFLAHWDGRTLPSAISRGGIAFAGALTVCTGLMALAIQLVE
ncbi:hypothetical protein F9278_02850 [Streptomyces phaeolivaceus]|uniref:Uncharacterized protein n=1 Tax=Streptomyces phaeolivaceus TaxID=2653200 RepID=A0A5P8KH60_9ACTN|nr:hypothetical protein F9278_02850 [Streptomyces phaeolivaceus]